MPNKNVRVFATLANLVLLCTLGWLAFEISDSAAEAAHVLPPLGPQAWAPPAWFPEQGRDALWVLEDLDGEPMVEGRQPRVRARAAIIADLDRAEVLWTHNADDPWPVASLTKMVSGLALASLGADLDQQLCVDWELWPSRPGARSRFETGVCHQGWEYLGAAMVASDNRGAMAFPRLADVDYYVFLDAMHDVSQELRLDSATWTDPAGLEDDNMATARDMLKAAVAVSEHPALGAVATAPFWQIDRRRGKRRLGTTNRNHRRYQTLAAKTGYTDTSRYCFATVVETRTGRRLAAAVLGSPTVQSRFDDANRMVRWAESDSR